MGVAIAGGGAAVAVPVSGGEWSRPANDTPFALGPVEGPSAKSVRAYSEIDFDKLGLNGSAAAIVSDPDLAP